MWKLKCIANTIFFQRKARVSSIFFQGKRFFLSDSFRCQEVWEQRLQSSILQNLRLDEMYHELEQKYQHGGQASVIDIDLFANAVVEDSYADELEDLIHKLRLSANTYLMLPSTPHAFIRTFLSLGRNDDLIRVLNDRLNYGIFPDDYCSCLLMDSYIKENKFAEAAKISVLQMLQEDWSHPLTAHLALYSCHKFLENPGVWTPETVTEEEDTGEEIKVRVKYLRNPYFDDHFDLRDPNLLVGKTLATLGATLPDAIGRTYQLVGLCLYQKWEKVTLLLQSLLKSTDKPIIYKAGITMLEDILKQHFDDSNQDTKDKIISLVKDLDLQGLVCSDDLHTAVVNKVKDVVGKEEAQVIELQKKTYEEWEVTREKVLQEHLQRLQTQQRLAQVQQTKEELMKREQELFFFDNEEKWDLMIEKKTSFVPTRKWEGKKKRKRVQDENYVPPEV